MVYSAVEFLISELLDFKSVIWLDAVSAPVDTLDVDITVFNPDVDF